MSASGRQEGTVGEKHDGLDRTAVVEARRAVVRLSFVKQPNSVIVGSGSDHVSVDKRCASTSNIILRRKILSSDQFHCCIETS